MFVDEATLTVRGGDGGNGCMSFRREKFVPRGGPDGGDGGHGGSVVLVADLGVSTLLRFRQQPLFKAERGRHGQGANKTGRSGRDLVLPVPVGTIVLDDSGVRALADLDRPGARYVASAGGRGGRGNARFTSSVNRAPTRHEPGERVEERVLRLELKLLADVGLLGFPNAGKSTLISRLSAARPKIAAYPFTTLEPQLGVVDCGGHRSFVMADIPGLIEGAHRGVGLGHRFLRHVERCRLLLHLVDVTDPERAPLEAVDALNEELRRFREPLAERPQILVATKSDAIQQSAPLDRLRAMAERRGLPLLVVSSVTGEGLETLVREVAEMLDTLREQDPEPDRWWDPSETPADLDEPEPETIGVMGGTFDPVHYGHLRIARSVRERFALQRMVLVPTASPPHKPAEALSPIADRLAMLRLALDGWNDLDLSLIEADPQRTSFTIDTLRRLRGARWRPVYVMGLDQLLEIESWHESRELVDSFDLIVVDRPGRSTDELERLPAAIRARVTPCDDEGPLVLDPPLGSGGRIVLIRPEPIPISSSLIRERVAAGEPLDELVPDRVAGYIQRSGLYRPQEASR